MALKISNAIYSAGDGQRNVIYEVTYLRVIVDNIELDDSSFPVQVLWPVQRTLLHSPWKHKITFSGSFLFKYLHLSDHSYPLFSLHVLVYK